MGKRPPAQTDLIDTFPISFVKTKQKASGQLQFCQLSVSAEYVNNMQVSQHCR